MNKKNIHIMELDRQRLIDLIMDAQSEAAEDYDL